jgi:hypothetical protein
MVMSSPRATFPLAAIVGAATWTELMTGVCPKAPAEKTTR